VFEKITRQDIAGKHILHTTDIAAYIFHNLNFLLSGDGDIS